MRTISGTSGHTSRGPMTRTPARGVPLVPWDRGRLNSELEGALVGRSPPREAYYPHFRFRDASRHRDGLLSAEPRHIRAKRITGWLAAKGCGSKAPRRLRGARGRAAVNRGAPSPSD